MRSRFLFLVAALASLAACFQPVAEDPNLGWYRDTGAPGRDSGSAGPEETLAACSDGADNDGDGRIDCEDPDCWLACHPPDGGRPWPDAGSPRPDAGAPRPDAGFPRTDAGTLRPDAGSQPRPDAGCVPNCAPDSCGLDGCGGSCGLCPDGKACNPAGFCVQNVCDPPVGPCGPDQYCDVSSVDPMCVEICGPVGCPAQETCVHDTPTTGHCAPPSCAGLACQQGQACFFWGGSGSCSTDAECTSPDRCVAFSDGKRCGRDVCSCQPRYTDASGVDHDDTCWQYGLVCGMDLTSAAATKPSECRMPLEFEDCTAAVGCAAPSDGGRLDCVSYGSGSLCMRNCANGTVPDSKRCVLDYTTCLPSGMFKNHCYVNICADPSCFQGGSGCAADKERAKYFKPCTSLSPNDSTCVQWVYSDHTEIGACVQGGTAPRGGECDPGSTRSEPSPYAKHCQPPVMDAAGNVTTPGEQCARVEAVNPADPNTAFRGLCRPQCNAYTGTNPAPVSVMPCAAGQVCLDSVSDPLIQKTRVGQCVPGCDLFGSDACAADVLGNKTGCTATYDFAGPGWCQATVDAPAGPGASCTWSQSEPRNPCGDRLFCASDASGAGSCTSWCQSALCPNQFASCSSCGGGRCMEIMTDASGTQLMTPVQLCEPN
ncbi:MAG TPA: hypothetical protein VGK67_14355 [Myxococcales bacterium]|jgi:hypothetical protein